MQVVLVKREKIYRFPFPIDETTTSYWLNDVDDDYNERNLISLEKIDDKWNLVSNSTCYIEVGEKQIKNALLSVGLFYSLKIVDANNNISSALLYVENEEKETYITYNVVQNGEYTIGNRDDQNIRLRSSVVNNAHAVLTKNEKGFFIRSLDTKYGIYINDNKTDERSLENGDIVFILGFRLIVLNDFIIINNSDNVIVNSPFIVPGELPSFNDELIATVDNDNAVLYNENDYFSRQPRFVTSITPEKISIDSPPGKIQEDQTPVIYTIGPMITMTMSSAVSVTTSIMNIQRGNATFKSTLPALLVAVAMIASTILWPSLMKKYNKKKTIESEKERQVKYSEYLQEKRAKITTIKNNQHQILLENYPDPKDLASVILNKKRNLWERQIGSYDFLSIRLGLGTVPVQLNLRYSMEDFSMVEDNLKNELNSVAEIGKDIKNAPVTINLTEKNKLVLIGETRYKDNMLRSMLLQLATWHSYNDLKFVFMINDTTSNIWNSVKTLPHTWSNSRDIRFFADNYDDMTKISFYLEQIFISRKYSEDDNEKRIENNLDFRSYRPYYLIVVDNIKKNKNIEIIKKILEEKTNIGFGLIILNDGISNLPNECNDFLSVDEKNSAIITNDLNKKNQQAFVMDDVSEVNLPLLCEKLSNIPIKQSNMLSETDQNIGFLEMYKVGKIEHLNIFERWQNNNPVNSLSVPIGIHTDGEIFNLDLHEKFHGPHGLIAGMTGSGKSEFIITYILSMCLNFSPEEVSFVLIDYKGGGLTGAFENKLTGMKLPHLAGTITNLDKAEINRSLASIKSELKRRQELFNKAKFELNESTLDIYKYQKLYRDGIIKEPMSHLFIITDEFAELKSQQSEFMAELISTARIGRSLGVHLILATQKPSGIVDDQIWSNSKFKVCLKVQERADSMDVIKCPDATSIKKAGRFYLQVGYNDYFAMGQAAYAGTKYIPKEKVAKTVDRDISFINDIGDTTKSLETTKRVDVVSLGEELPNVLKYICDAAKTKNMAANKLWLDKIPAEIFVNNLMQKYSFVPKPWNIEAVIGEYDDPENQSQGLLTVNLNSEGNTLVYGSGSEILLSSLVYSLIISHSSKEVNIYIVDFGTEMFGIFVNAPQVGDVVYINEEEKIANLFATVARELEVRKKLFANYNGSYDIFIKNSGRTLPKMIIIINNYELLNENYDDYVDLVSSLSREGEKYGIIFVITASASNGVRGKTTQNFGRQICIQMNDSADYSSILGNTHGMVPSNIAGRGLIKIDGELHEFQTAYPYKWDEINTFIKSICTKLNQRVKDKAERIAVLPEHVTLLDVSDSITNLSNVPIGIEKNTLATSMFNFNKNLISLVSSQDSTLLDKFVPSLGQVFQSIENVELYMVDSNEVLKDTDIFRNFYTSNIPDVYKKMTELTTNDNGKTNMFMFFGIDQMFAGLTRPEVDNFKSILANLKNYKNIRVVIADSVGKIKSIEYEEFFRNSVQTLNAIWIGSGITDQFTIKSSTYTRETRGQIPLEFGFNVTRGNATLVKLLDFYTKD